jgi:hypothetical protein
LARRPGLANTDATISLSGSETPEEAAIVVTL